MSNSVAGKARQSAKHCSTLQRGEAGLLASPIREAQGKACRGQEHGKGKLRFRRPLGLGRETKQTRGEEGQHGLSLAPLKAFQQNCGSQGLPEACS